MTDFELEKMQLRSYLADGEVDKWKTIVKHKLILRNFNEYEVNSLLLEVCSNVTYGAELSKFLLDKADADVNYQCDSVFDSHFGSTPLIEAARFGSMDTVECLLSYGANVSLKDKDGSTALDYVQKDYDECASDIDDEHSNEDEAYKYELLELLQKADKEQKLNHKTRKKR